MLCVFATAEVAFATITARMTVSSVTGGCNLGDPDPFPEGDPARFFRLAIFDSNSAGVLDACGAGCFGDSNPSTIDGKTLDYCATSTGCALWDFPNQTLVKVLPPSQGAYFYFGLFDQDIDADDALGDHWFFADGPSSGAVSNNHLAPFKPNSPISSVCGDPVASLLGAGNYELAYSAWFEDSTAPSSVPTPVATDDGGPVTWDNDNTLDFSWASASDPDSGIQGYEFSLYRVSTGDYVFLNEPAPANRQVSICPSGCTRSHTPLDGEQYAFIVLAANGLYPTIANPLETFSEWTDVSVDLVSPISSVSNPAAGWWHGGDFSVSPLDSDTGAGLDLGACQRSVTSDGVTTLDWTSRTCNGSFTTTVGAASQCRHQGANTCVVSIRSTDLARRVSAIASRSFSIDYTADAITSITAATAQGGATIAASTWQPDSTPFLSWSAAASMAPISGYSYAWDAGVDCASETATASASFSLTEGQHLFAVRALDAAGNCGTPANFTLWVDSAGDAVSDLACFTEQGGMPIAQASWTADRDPYFAWSAPASASPIAGYSYALDGAADCTQDASTSGLDIAGPLANGQHQFAVRALDLAGNCGPATTFQLWVADSLIFADSFESGAPWEQVGP